MLSALLHRHSRRLTSQPVSDVSTRTGIYADEHPEDPELKLPKKASLAIIIIANVLLQISFFIIVSSSNQYADFLGGSSTFSGIVIGIPTLFSGMALLPMMRFDQGGYKRPLHMSCASLIVGQILYACAYRTHYLYLILIGRIVSGFGFSMWMYCKRYCSDPRIVGIRRRTTLASLLVIGQGLGMSLGPFAGGILYKIGFQNSVFNGYTAPGWIMAGVWVIFWACVTKWYEDPASSPEPIEMDQMSATEGQQDVSIQAIDRIPTLTVTGQAEQFHAPIDHSSVHSMKTTLRHLTASQYGVIATMCWFALTCFFVLGSFESNLPVFGASMPQLDWSPFAAGNFIALGGICAFPFLLGNLVFARRTQDRKLLAFGCILGLLGLLIFLSLLSTNTVSYGSLFACWFAVALGFNLATTVTLSLLSKQLPGHLNLWTSLAIQYSNYAGRVGGAVWGGAGVKVGMINFVCVEVGMVGLGIGMFLGLWRDLKAKKG